MALEQLKAQIDLLMQQMVDQPEDAHEIQELLREKLNGLRAMGMPLPADLVDLERKLDSGFGRTAKSAKGQASTE
ncbi:hypothetical protein C7441_106190 [Pseudaminobacter salicylatoxidans]|uniref:Uncharacterized protein n=1 Tax=Pseudaminobacter salicylatoxidans TaxID=93369 RepID=A0A316CQ18_PSESE|nr:hypothetical protein [Pseudaminobacter salicylatoxidans]PWJ84274.1 hypothetical protein C7441_106190 [Pseudaminobacter salicylatoxidans]